MTQEMLLAVITGVFTMITPVAIQWRKSRNWSKTFRVALPVMVSLVISVTYLVFASSLSGSNLLESFLMVYGLQQLVYATVIKHMEAFKAAPPESGGSQE